MSKKLRLQVTMTVEAEYEVDIADYDTSNPQRIIWRNQSSFEENPYGILEMDSAKWWVDVEDITNAIS